MNINNLNVEETINKANQLLKKEKNISPALRSVILSVSIEFDGGFL